MLLQRDKHFRLLELTVVHVVGCPPHSEEEEKEKAGVRSSRIMTRNTRTKVSLEGLA